MGARKKLAEVIDLPVKVKKPSRVYRVEVGTKPIDAVDDPERPTFWIPPAWIDALLDGVADHKTLDDVKLERVRNTLVATRVRAFSMPFDAFSGGYCALVAGALRNFQPSELARAIVGASRDPYWCTRNPSFRVMWSIDRLPGLVALADRQPPKTPAEAKVDAAAKARVMLVQLRSLGETDAAALYAWAGLTERHDALAASTFTTAAVWDAFLKDVAKACGDSE